MKVLKSRGVVPPGGYVRYRDPDDGWYVQHPYYGHVKLAAHEHRIEAGLPIPFNWDEWFDEQVCEATPTACIETGDKPSETKVTLLSMAKSFTSSMVRWARSGFAVADYETYRDRFTTCSGDETKPRCQYFTHWAGTGLTRCGACGCSSVKLWVKGERCPKGKW